MEGRALNLSLLNVSGTLILSRGACRQAGESDEGLPQVNPWSEEVKPLVALNPAVYAAEGGDGEMRSDEGRVVMSIITSRFLFVTLGIALAGCATPYSYKMTLDQNPYMTPAQVRERFGQPISDKTYPKSINQTKFDESNVDATLAEGRNKVIETYRTAHPEESVGLSDDAVFDRAKALVKERLREKQKKAEIVTIYEYRPFGPFYIVFDGDHIAYYGDFSRKGWIQIYYNLGLIDEDDYRWKYSNAVQEEIADRQYSLERARLRQEKELAEKELNYQRQKDLFDRRKAISDSINTSQSTHCVPDGLGGFRCTSY